MSHNAEALKRQHYQHVKRALREGKEVPRRVLEEYPDLLQISLSLAEEPAESQADTDSPLVDAVLNRGLAGVTNLSDEIRRRIKRAVKKKFGG
jgi:hypothetical protein